MHNKHLAVIIFLFICPLSSWAGVGSCVIHMTSFHHVDNDYLRLRFLRLDPFARLRAVSKARELPPEEFHLDDPLRLSIDKKEAKLLYNYLLSLWPAAKIIELSQASDISDKKFQDDLRTTRSWLKRLRSAAITLSARHRVSAELDRLIVVMGRIRDLVKNGRVEEASQFLPELKMRLSKRSRESITAEISDFNPTSKKQFEFWLGEELDHIKVRLKDNKIKPKQFHDLRKFVDNLTALFGALYALDPTTETHDYFCFLVSLNTKMGEFNDLLIATHYRKRIEFPEEIRYNLLELIINLNS